MLDATLTGLRQVEDTFAVDLIATRFETDLDADFETFIRTRRDPLIGLLRLRLEGLLLGPVPSSGEQSGADRNDQRAVASESFDQGYTVGRLASGTHQRALLYSGLTRADLRSARTVEGAATLQRHDPAAFRQIDQLQGVLLDRETGLVFLDCIQLRGFLHRLSASYRSTTRDVAFQFAGFGLVTSICESLALTPSN